MARAVQRKCLASVMRGGALRHRMNEQFWVHASAPAPRPAGPRSCRGTSTALTATSAEAQPWPTILSFPQALGSAHHLYIREQQGIIGRSRFGPRSDFHSLKIPHHHHLFPHEFLKQHTGHGGADDLYKLLGTNCSNVLV